MSRYKVRFVPEGAIPQDSQTGIHMQRLQEAPAAVEVAGTCCNDCGGWAVTIDSVASTGNFHIFPDAATAINIVALGTLCPGACIEWELRPILDTVATADFTVTPNGCDGVDLAGAGSVSYANTIFGMFATIAGQPYCEPVIFVQGDVACVYPTFPGWNYAVNGPDPPESATTPVSANTITFPNGAFYIDVSPIGLFGGADVCMDNLTGIAVSFAGGDAGAYGDFAVASYADLGSLACGWRVTCNGAHDYTGIQFSVQVSWVTAAVAWGDQPNFVCVDF